MPEASPYVFDVVAAQFEDAVIRRSTETPVIVDFWSPSCQPCLQLAPILEKVVNESNGNVLLAKVNIDECQDLASMMGIQSIPLVVAFSDGRPVDQFMGLVPEDQLREWIQQFVPSQAVQLVQEALLLEVADAATAIAKLRESLEIEAADSTKIHLARVLVAQNLDQEASGLIAELESRGFLEPDAQTLKAQLEMRASAEESGGLQAARVAADANPGDLTLQIRLAEAMAVDGLHREAMDVLLAIVQLDRGSEEANKARGEMVTLFGVLGDGSALVGEYRRKLATALY